MVCKQCGAQNADNVKFCSACGARMEDDKVACKSCGQMNAKDAVFCAFCGGRTDGQTKCSACGTVHEGKFCPNCGHAEGAAPAPQAAPAPAAPVYTAPAPAAPAYTAAPVAPAPVYAPVAAKAPMNTLQKILSIVGSAVLMLGVLFAVIGLFGIGVEMKYDSAMLSAMGVNASDTTFNMGGLFYYFSDYSYDAYAGVYAETMSAGYLDVPFFLMIPEVSAEMKAAGDLSLITESMPGEIVTAVTMTQIFGIGISLTTAALVIGFAIPAIIAFIKNLTGKENNFGKWAILTVVMFFMGSGILYGLNIYAWEIIAEAESVSYGFNGITKVAIILGCIGIGVFVATKLFASWKSWLNTKGILRVSFAVVAVVALAFVFTAAKEAAVTVTTVEGDSNTWSLFQLVIRGEYDYVIVSEEFNGETFSQVFTGKEWDMMMSQGGYDYSGVPNYVGDSLLIYGIFMQMLAIVVAILAAVALGKMLKNLWSEEKSGHLGISIVLLIFTLIYAVFAFVAKSQIEVANEALAGGSLMEEIVALPEVSVTPIIIGAVFAVINLGMAIAQKVVAPKPVAPVNPYGYGMPAYAAPQAPQYGAPQNYNNNNMSFGG